MAFLIACGSKPDLTGDPVVQDAATRASLAITPASATIATGSTTMFTIQNTGQDTTAPIGLAISGPDSAGFVLVKPMCTVLAPNESCMVGVYSLGAMANGSATLEATATKDVTASASLSGDDTIGSGALAITATNAGAATFATTALGATSPPVSYTVTNTTNASAGTITMSIVLNEFKLASDACTGKVLGPAAQCQVTVTFSPTTGPSTAHTGMLIAQGFLGITGSIGLTATAETSIYISPSAHAFGPISICATGTASSYGFSAVNPTISPSVPWSSLVMPPALGGADATEFQIITNTDTCTSSSTTTCMFTVQVIGKDVSTVARTATITAMATINGITSNASSTVSATITQCDVTITTNGMTDAETINFGMVDLNTTPVAQMIVVKNVGAVAHTPTLSFGGSTPTVFTFTQDGCTGVSIAPGGQCMALVGLKATQTGTFMATVITSVPGLTLPQVQLAAIVQ